MTFSSVPKILFIRVVQILMPLFTFVISFGTPHDPVFEIVWYSALVGVEWFAFNIVSARLDETGLSYHRFGGVKHVPWNSVRSVTLWRAAGGIVVRLEGRTLLRRYKFLLDSHPGIETVAATPSEGDSPEISFLRKKMTGSIW